MDRLKVEGFKWQIMRNHDSSLLEAKIVETEKGLNGLIRALRDDWYTSAFSLQPKYLSSYKKFINQKGEIDDEEKNYGIHSVFSNGSF